MNEMLANLYLTADETGVDKFFLTIPDELAPLWSAWLAEHGFARVLREGWGAWVYGLDAPRINAPHHDQWALLVSLVSQALLLAKRHSEVPLTFVLSLPNDDAQVYLPVDLGRL